MINSNHFIDLQLDHKPSTLPPATSIQDWASAVLSETNQPPSELTLRTVSLDEIQQLNAQYRSKNKPTNVLSFPSNLPQEIQLEYALLGDILICPEVVHAESEQQHKSFEAHFAHMVIHGILHLLGYDHIKEEDAHIMEPLEIKLLATLGYPNPYEVDS